MMLSATLLYPLECLFLNVQDTMAKFQCHRMSTHVPCLYYMDVI